MKPTRGKSFRLKRIHEIRTAMEDKRQKKLAEKDEEMRETEARLAMLEKKKSDFLRHELTDIQGLNAVAMLNRYGYSEMLSERISDQSLDVQRAINEVNQARQQLLIATKDKKVLERLREIYQEREQYEERKREQLHLDEIASRKRPDPSEADHKT